MYKISICTLVTYSTTHQSIFKVLPFPKKNKNKNNNHNTQGSLTEEDLRNIYYKSNLKLITWGSHAFYVQLEYDIIYIINYGSLNLYKIYVSMEVCILVKMKLLREHNV